MRILRSPLLRRFMVIGITLFLAAGCIRLERIVTPTAAPSEMPTTQPTEGTTPTPDYGWKDVHMLVEGVCFEAALKLAGQVIIIRDANALDSFYSQVENSSLCEDPINRVPYPFETDEMIVGLWSAGTGCTAQHVVQHILRDDMKKQETIQLKFVTDGECPYELVHPFWIALPQSGGYDVQIVVD